MPFTETVTLTYTLVSAQVNLDQSTIDAVFDRSGHGTTHENVKVHIGADLAPTELLQSLGDTLTHLCSENGLL